MRAHLDEALLNDLEVGHEDGPYAVRHERMTTEGHETTLDEEDGLGFGGAVFVGGLDVRAHAGQTTILFETVDILGQRRDDGVDVADVGRLPGVSVLSEGGADLGVAQVCLERVVDLRTDFVGDGVQHGGGRPELLVEIVKDVTSLGLELLVSGSPRGDDGVVDLVLVPLDGVEAETQTLFEGDGDVCEELFRSIRMFQTDPDRAGQYAAREGASWKSVTHPAVGREKVGVEGRYLEHV